LTIKKTLHDSGKLQPHVTDKISAHIHRIANLDPQRLIFLDESSINTGMTRLYGRSQNGKRIYDYVPDVRFQRTSIVSTLRLDGEMVPLTFKGSLNGERFGEYVKEYLAPTLREGDIVFWDGLQAHKNKEAREAVLAAKAKIIYLPPYSPEFNPIELMWSKVKAYLRKVKARTIDALETAIAEALKTVTLADIANWVKHCGYVHVL
jgi:transposase